MANEPRGDKSGCAEAERAIQEHNQGCLEACGKTTSHQYVRDSRRCDSRRDCPDCPKDWMIEWPKALVKDAPPLTKREKNALLEAIGFRLSGETDDADVEALESAKAKL